MAVPIVGTIYEALASHGDALLATPGAFETVLSRLNGIPAKELAAVTAALEHGAVRDLVVHPGTDRQELSTMLARRSGLPAGRARWAVESWAAALAAVKAGQPPREPVWDTLRTADIDASPPGPFRCSVGAALAVMLVGAVAGALPGVVIAVGVEHGQPQAVRARKLFERREPVGQRLTPPAIARWAGLLGGLGGLIGAGLGWTVGGFANPLRSRVLGAVCGATWAFDGAAFGLVYAGLGGAMFGPMAAAAGGVIVAGGLGRFAPLTLLVPAAWLVLPHF